MGTVHILPDRRVFKRMNCQFTARDYIFCITEYARENNLQKAMEMVKRDRAKGTIDGWLCNITLDALEAAYMDCEIDDVKDFVW